MFDAFMSLVGNSLGALVGVIGGAYMERRRNVKSEYVYNAKYISGILYAYQLKLATARTTMIDMADVQKGIDRGHAYRIDPAEFNVMLMEIRNMSILFARLGKEESEFYNEELVKIPSTDVRKQMNCLDTTWLQEVSDYIEVQIQKHK